MAVDQKQADIIQKGIQGGSEESRALWNVFNPLSGFVSGLKREWDAWRSSNFTVVRSTDNGESGITRTYKLPVSEGYAVIAQVCGVDATVLVGAATCLDGEVEIKFDVDPGTTHKVAIMVSTPS